MDKAAKQTLSEWIPAEITLEPVEQVKWRKRAATGERRTPIHHFGANRDEEVFTDLEILLKYSALRPPKRPNGFIFHLSRSGSTAVANALSQVDGHLVYTELGSINTLLESVNNSQNDERLRALILALGPPEKEIHQSYFFKFTSWNTVYLDRLLRIFPEVPWIFMYRDPVEVLVSTSRKPPAWMKSPSTLRPLLGPVEESSLESPEVTWTLILEKICESVIRNINDKAVLINYNQVKSLDWRSLTRHFELPCSDGEIELMKSGLSYYSKDFEIKRNFEDDSAEKQQAATMAIHELSDRHLKNYYLELERRRLEKYPRKV
jgi:hypothetical protein